MHLIPLAPPTLSDLVANGDNKENFNLPSQVGHKNQSSWWHTRVMSKCSSLVLNLAEMHISDFSDVEPAELEGICETLLVYVCPATKT